MENKCYIVPKIVAIQSADMKKHTTAKNCSKEKFLVT